jgi:uncharacterized membrane protein
MKLTTAFLVLLPLLSIIGVQLVNNSHNNLILLLLFPLIAIVPILVMFDFIPEKLYTFAVFIVAISLLLSTALVSNQFFGADVNQEYYFASKVTNASFWDSSIPNDYNAVLSVTVLAPILSIVIGIDLLWIFKLIFPILFSLVPLVLYCIFKKMTDGKIAFLSVFLLMSVVTFFTEMVNVTRQEIAEIFLVLILLILVSKTGGKKTGLISIFLGLSLIVSHYAMAYIFAFMLIFAFLMFILSNNLKWKWFRDFNLEKSTGKILNISFIFIFCISVFLWYSYISLSASFNMVVGIGNNIAQNIFTDFLNPDLAQGLSLMTRQAVSPFHQITKYMNIIFQFFIFIGLVKVFSSYSSKKFAKEYLCFAAAGFVLCIAAIGIPYLASYLNTSRLYHIALLILSPFSILGGMFLLTYIPVKLSAFLKRPHSFSQSLALKILSLILAIFLLFGSGFFSELANDPATSVSLSQNSIKNYGTSEDKIQLYNSFTPYAEAVSAEWLSQYRIPAFFIYSDHRARTNALNAFAGISRSEISVITNNTESINSDSYVYLRTINVRDNLMGGAYNVQMLPIIYNATNFVTLLNGQTDKIYSNGDSEIYFSTMNVPLRSVW